MNSEKLGKYEDWIRDLEVRQNSLSASRATFGRLFAGVLVASSGGFLLNVWVGAGTFATGVMICAFGFYALRVRMDEYTRELAQTRQEVARLRARVQVRPLMNGPP